MRVSVGTLTENVIAQIRQAAARMEAAQNALSTGKRISKPSDDPVGVARSLNLRSALAAIEQYQTNNSTAGTLLSAMETAFETITNGLKEARTIAVAAANSALTPESKQGYAAQIDNIMERVLDALNTRQMDRYIFAGHATDAQPFVASVGANPYDYVGDSGILSIQIHTGTPVQVSMPGDVVANINGGANPAIPDIFTSLRDLRSDVLGDNPSEVSANLEDVDAHISNILSLRAQVGARIQKVEDLYNLTEDSKIRLKQLLSDTEDADLPEMVVELQTQQQVYQAALAVAASITRMTLVDWLR